MDKFFWFSLPITLMILYLFIRFLMGSPVKRRDINMIAALYLICYLFITAGLGLFWVARMDLPAFDLHYLFGYCLLFLVFVHLWFQLPLLAQWLKKNSPSFLLDDTKLQWKPKVKTGFLIILVIILYSAVSLLMNEWLTPVTSVYIESNTQLPGGHRTWFRTRGKLIKPIEYVHHQGDIKPGAGYKPRFNLVKSPEFKTFATYPETMLPTPETYASTSLSQALATKTVIDYKAMNIMDLSNLLYYTYGVTERLDYPGGPLLLRAAASAGALYPNDLYVVALQVAGLSPGIYYYHPAHHSLINITKRTSLPELLQATPFVDLEKHAAAMIILTTNFDRTIWKYYERSFRYIVPDAGHVLGNLTLVAAAIQLPYTGTGFFDDARIIKALGLSQQEEGVLSLVVLGKNSLEVKSKTPAFSAMELPKEVQDVESTRLAYQLTSLRWTGGFRSPPEVRETFNKDSIPAQGALIALPNGSIAQEDAFTVIKNRRSFRQFSAQKVALRDFSSVIQQAYAKLSHPSLGARAKSVELYLVISRVQGISPGIYRYISEKTALEKIRGGDFSKAIYQAGLSQELLQRAAFVIAWGVDLDRIGWLHGDRDYRQALLESGIGAETTYLVAGALGLGACSVGAFYDEYLRELLKLQATAKYIVLLTAVGNK